MIFKCLIFVTMIILNFTSRATSSEIEGVPNNVSIPKIYDGEIPDSSFLILEKMKRINFSDIARLERKRHKQNTQTQNSTDNFSSGITRPCTCAAGICKCCTGFFLDLFKQKACVKIAYHPGDFAFDVTMLMNDRVLYENSVSGKNPRPMCINPPRLSNLKLCAKFYNVFFPGRNFHFCLAMTGQWGSNELFKLSFDCLRMGANGIAMLKPEDSGGLVIPNPQGGVDAVVDSGDEDIEDYDDTNFVKSLFEILDK